MSQRRVTPGKSTRVRPLEIGRTDEFYDLRPEQFADLGIFLERFRMTWFRLRRHGISEFAAILRLVRVLPAQWQGWASTHALDYIDYTREPEESGNFMGFHALVREQYRDHQGPPPGEYPPIHYFQPFIHQLFDAHRVRQGDPPSQPTEDTPPDSVSAQSSAGPSTVDPTPMDPVVAERIDSPPPVEVGVHSDPDDYYAHPEIDPLFADMFLAEGIPFPNQESQTPTIDMDLYDQPFALPSPILSDYYDDPVVSQTDSTTLVPELVPGSYPVHAVPLESIPPTAPVPSFGYPSHLMEVHLFQEPPPPPDEGAGSSRPPGFSRSFHYEPEWVQSVGKGKAQYIPVSEMSFVTDPYILHPKWKVISHDNNPLRPKSPEPYYREEDIEPLRYAPLRHSLPDLAERVEASGSGVQFEDLTDVEEPGPSDGQ